MLFAPQAQQLPSGLSERTPSSHRAVLPRDHCLRDCFPSHWPSASILYPIIPFFLFPHPHIAKGTPPIGASDDPRAPIMLQGASSGRSSPSNLPSPHPRPWTQRTFENTQLAEELLCEDRDGFIEHSGDDIGSLPEDIRKCIDSDLPEARALGFKIFFTLLNQRWATRLRLSVINYFKSTKYLEHLLRES